MVYGVVKNRSTRNMTKAPDMTILFILSLDLLVFAVKAAIITAGVAVVVKVWKQPIIFK